jgi:serine/threonine protein phosphatase 1
MERCFAVGDIHGCLDKLERLMEEIGPDPRKDTLIFLGDYIDRGPDSRGVVEFILDIRETHPRVACLMGNHEEMFLDFIRDQSNRALYFLNGGRATLKSYGLDAEGPVREKDIPETHLRFFRTLLLHYEWADFIFVHAGLRPGVPLEKQDREDLIWIRNTFIFGPWEGEKKVVFGHTPFRHPYESSRRIGIDTGAVFGGPLTCLELPAMTFHQVWS